MAIAMRQTVRSECERESAHHRARVLIVSPTIAGKQSRSCQRRKNCCSAISCMQFLLCDKKRNVLGVASQSSVDAVDTAFFRLLETPGALIVRIRQTRSFYEKQETGCCLRFRFRSYFCNASLCRVQWHQGWNLQRELQCMPGRLWRRSDWRMRDSLLPVPDCCRLPDSLIRPGIGLNREVLNFPLQRIFS